MARPVWKGHISFGLVSIPVTLFSGERKGEISFHMIDTSNKARVRYNRVNEETGEPVPNDRIVLGYEFDKDQYVLLNDEDFSKVDVEATKRIEIEDFVDAAEISPLYFDKPYYLEPGKAGEKGYALLRETLRMQNKVGVAKLVLRSRQYLGAVIPEGDLLVLMILRFDHELRKGEEFHAPSASKGEIRMSQREIDMAIQLVEAMTSEWEPGRYQDEYRDRLLGYIEEKIKAGELEAGAGEVPEEEPAEEEERVVNLVDYLKQSVEEARKRREKTEAAANPKSGKGKKPSPGKTARKKTSRKQTA